MKIISSIVTLNLLCLSFLPMALCAENTYAVHRESAIQGFSGMPWGAKRHLQLVNGADAFQAGNLNDSQSFGYPISEEQLGALYENTQTKTVPFFAYSSMIDLQSGAAKAISADAASTQTAAVAFGIQRVFNRQMAANVVEGGWGALKRENDLAILNSFKKPDALLNGVVFDLPMEDLHILTKREVGYDLIPVVCMRWNEAVDADATPEYFIAYTFLAAEVRADAVSYTSAHVNPIPGYFNYLQTGLDHFGDDFKAMWWATTYLADQTTIVRELPYQEIDLKY